MSSYDTTTEEVVPIADAILHGGNIPPAPEVDSGADVEPESGADVAVEDELLLGKFKTSEDMAAAYQNLEREFTQARQRAIDLESLLDDEPDEATPAWNSAFTGANPQNETELVSWAENNPGAAAQWAIANGERVGQDTVTALWEHWFEVKPTEAMAWYTTQQTQTIASQYEERISELQQQIAPLRDQQTQTLFESSIDLLEGQIPDLADYSEKIQAYIDNIPTDQLHLAFFPQGMDTSEKIQEGIKSLYAIVRMREAPMQPQQQGNVNQNAFTQSRQGIADTGPTDYDAKINAAILQG